MKPTLTFNKSIDGYTAMKDIIDILSFVHQSFEQSELINHGAPLQLSPQAVAGCATLLGCLIVGLHELADTGAYACDCQTKEGA